jgi:hypothetical protein
MGVDESLQRKEQIQNAIDNLKACKELEVYDAFTTATPAWIKEDTNFALTSSEMFTKLLDKSVKDADKKLKACKTLADLQTVYLSLPAPVKTKTVATKDEMKTKLSPVNTEA